MAYILRIDMLHAGTLIWICPFGRPKVSDMRQRGQEIFSQGFHGYDCQFPSLEWREHHWQCSDDTNGMDHFKVHTTDAGHGT